MTDPDGRPERRPRLDVWLPRGALVLLLAAWIALAATLPTSTNRDLTIDVFCTSGNPVVGVWIESRSGGSGFAQPGETGHTTLVRYTFRQKFTDKYQARVGCGGNPHQWGITVFSSFSDRTYGRLACDDVHIVATKADGCLDQPA